MKRKLAIWGGVLAVLALYTAGVWRLVTVLGVQGRYAPLVLRAGLVLLGLLVAIVVLIYLLRRPAPPPPIKDAIVEELQKALVAAEKKLVAAKAAPSGALGKLPVVLMLGAPGSTKTSSVVRSGMDVELLTGDVFRDDAVVTTRGMNLWFGRNVLFVEPGRDMTDEPARWRWLMRRLQAARLRGALSSGEQAPRVAVVCYGCDALTSPTAGDAAVAAARALRDRLGQLAQEFGIRLPVYVVFSKADRIPGFAEFVQNFTKDEVRAVLGATLPLTSRATGASHAERETKRLTDAWSRLFSGLASRRVEVLARETTGDRKPAAYEFPREFRKVGAAAVQFLVELCRPTELGLGPVLRGFYLTGVRAVVSTDAAAVPSLMPAREVQPAVAATSVFRPVAGSTAAPAAPVVGARKKPEWVFLSGLFQDVVLADSVAMGVTRGGARISALRRTLAGVGVGLAAALLIAFTVSFVRNRRLQRSVQRSTSVASTLPVATVAVPTGAQLTSLDSLRERVDLLSRYYHDGAPLSLRWGLYSGGDLYGPARRLYFDKFARLLYDSTRVGLARATRALVSANPASPNAVPYDSAYQLLRTYLVTTSEPTHSTPEFVGPRLVEAWPQARSVDSSARELARRQFEFFGRELQYGNPYGDQADATITGPVRQLLAKSSGISPIYISMATVAARHGQPVRFTAGQGTVVNPQEVPGQFTKGAWSYFVDTALTTDLDKFLQGEPWVTGGAVKQVGDKDSVARALKRLYIDDYVAAWKRYVRSASVAPFGDLADAARKVQVLASPTSPLLAMLLKVSENTVVDSAFLRARLQPVDVVMPLKNKDTFVGGANQEYMDQLGGLATALQQVVAVPRGADNGPQLQAALAASGKVGDAANKLSRQFSAEPERDLQLTPLLSSPGVRVTRLVTDAMSQQQRVVAAGAANKAAIDFCAQAQPVLDKFPFSRAAQAQATKADVAKLFKPNGGDIAQFYEQNLANTVLVRTGGTFRAAPGIAPNEALVGFMTKARRITDAMFQSGASEPRVQFSIRPHMTGTIPVTLTFGDETYKLERGNEQPITATWRFGDAASVAFSRPGSNRASSDGTWAPFRLYWTEATPGGPNGGRTYTVTLSGVTVGTVEMSIVGGLFEDPSGFALTCPTSAVR